MLCEDGEINYVKKQLITVWQLLQGFAGLSKGWCYYHVLAWSTLIWRTLLIFI